MFEWSRAVLLWLKAFIEYEHLLMGEECVCLNLILGVPSEALSI